MATIAATDRMARLIAAIPWIVAQDGVTLEEIAERFDYPRDVLLRDLQEVVFFVGVPPYTPDTLIEVLLEDDMVWIRYAEWFSRPMKLSSTETLALLTAGETALGFDGQGEAGALVRGLTKLRLATGSSSDVVDVELGTIATEALPILRQGARDRVAVDIVYFGFATDVRTERRVEPTRFFLDRGAWYVGGYCHRAQDQRVFRVDRIESAVLSGAAFNGPADESGESGGFALDRGEVITISAPANRSYVLEGVPVESLEVDDDALLVRLAIASPRWLEQLLLRLGPEASVVEGDAPIHVGDVASRLRERYLDA